MQLAEAVGIDPNEVPYVPYDGGGPLTSALLGNKIQVGFSGLGEFEGQIEAGELRALAVSGEERLTGESVKDVPTLQESDIDLVFTNWRGVLAPPGISEERRDELIAYLEEMHDSPEWQQALEDNGWIDAFKTGDEFETYPGGTGRAGRVDAEGAGTHMSTTEHHGQPRRERRAAPGPPAARPGRAARRRRRLHDLRRHDARGRLRRPGRTAGLPLRHRHGDCSSWPRSCVVATLRGDRPEEEGGEDVDLTETGRLADRGQAGRRSSSSRSPTINVLGWAITGAVLFAGSAWALGSRTLIRDVLIGAVLSVGSWYAFYVGLGIPLSPGILDGVL